MSLSPAARGRQEASGLRRFPRWLWAKRAWFAAAIAILEKGLEIDPLAEAFYSGLMQCHVALGQRAEAIGVYRRCQKMLAAGLGVAPGGKTVSLYQSLKRAKGSVALPVPAPISRIRPPAGIPLRATASSTSASG